MYDSDSESNESHHTVTFLTCQVVQFHSIVMPMRRSAVSNVPQCNHGRVAIRIEKSDTGREARV